MTDRAGGYKSVQKYAGGYQKLQEAAGGCRRAQEGVLVCMMVREGAQGYVGPRAQYQTPARVGVDVVAGVGIATCTMLQDQTSVGVRHPCV